MKKFIVLLLVAFQTGVDAQTIKTKTSPGIDLTSYDRFSVVKGEFTTPKDERKINEETLFQEIKKVVIRELESRGYQHTEDSTAQLKISYVAGVFNKIESENLGPMGGTPTTSGADMDQSRTWSRSSRQGFVIMDIQDIRAKREIWTAESQVDLGEADSIRTIEAVVHKSFRKFPSKLKKKKKKN